MRGAPACQGRSRDPRRHQHLDDRLRRPARHPGRGPRRHRASGPRDDPSRARRDAGPSPSTWRRRTAPDRVGGPLSPAHRGEPRRGHRRRPGRADRAVQPLRRADLRLVGREILGQSFTMLMPDGLRESHEPGFAGYLETHDPRIVGKTVEVQGLGRMARIPARIVAQRDRIGRRAAIHRVDPRPDRTPADAPMLARSDKLASIGLLRAGVAHEINNPLAYVGNNLAVLERDLKGVLEMMRALRVGHGALAAAAPDVLRAVEGLSEEIDWPYIREHLEQILARTRDGVQRVANIVQNLRGLARTAPPSSSRPRARPGRLGARDDPGTPPPPEHRHRARPRRRPRDPRASRPRSAR